MLQRDELWPSLVRDLLSSSSLTLLAVAGGSVASHPDASPSAWHSAGVRNSLPARAGGVARNLRGSRKARTDNHDTARSRRSRWQLACLNGTTGGTRPNGPRKVELEPRLAPYSRRDPSQAYVNVGPVRVDWLSPDPPLLDSGARYSYEGPLTGFQALKTLMARICSKPGVQYGMIF